MSLLAAIIQVIRLPIYVCARHATAANQVAIAYPGPIPSACLQTPGQARDLLPPGTGHPARVTVPGIVARAERQRFEPAIRMGFGFNSFCIVGGNGRYFSPGRIIDQKSKGACPRGHVVCPVGKIFSGFVATARIDCLLFLGLFSDTHRRQLV